jgi:hypothetical protein
MRSRQLAVPPPQTQENIQSLLRTVSAPSSAPFSVKESTKQPTTSQVTNTVESAGPSEPRGSRRPSRHHYQPDSQEQGVDLAGEFAAIRTELKKMQAAQVQLLLVSCLFF